jgi:protein SCO1/2
MVGKETPKMLQRRALFTAGSAAAAVATGAVVGSADVLAAPPAAAVAQAERTFIPNTEVVDQDGKRHRFYDDLVKGRVVLINFFFTSCGETCPLVTENLRAVQDLLGERMGRDIFMYSVSLQPELETPAILQDYAAIWEVRPGWRFLTGRPAEIERLRKGLGFASAEPARDRILDNHTGLVRYGNDRVDRWGGVPGLARAAWIAKAVAALADVA